MPRRSEGDFFLLVCTEEELQRHLAICRSSDFHIEDDAVGGCVRVHDRRTILLRAERGALGWLVFLHRQYYRHPFHPTGSGDALPGVP
jgi:hypothetical protein